MNDPLASDPQSLPGQSRRRILWVAVALVAVAGAATAFLLLRSDAPAAVNTDNANSTNRTNTVIPPVATIPDEDRDRLSDDEERDLRTDPAVPDSDRDALGDYEEARVWLTDPLQPDTDNDGTRDGDEVRSGTDPKGPGRFLDLTNAISNVNG